jgi:hypothetical protein
MSAPLHIRYALVGTGWSSCVVEHEGTHIELSASYLSDALGNLVKAALAIASSFRTVEFGFDEEPGEYRWVLEANENNVLRFRLLEFQDLWGYKPNAEGRLLLDASITPIVFAKAVHACAAEVLQEHGEKGYAEKWAEHPFPTRELELLAEVIAGLENDA